ncbi:MAG: hypothetical protein Kow0027_05150 [Saprospiraceae bacterium]
MKVISKLLNEVKEVVTGVMDLLDELSGASAQPVPVPVPKDDKNNIAMGNSFDLVWGYCETNIPMHQLFGEAARS